MPRVFHSSARFYSILFVLSLLSYGFWLWLTYPGVLYGDNMTMFAESFPSVGTGDQHSVMFVTLLKISNFLFGVRLSYPLIWGLFFWHAGIFSFVAGLYTLYRNYAVLLFAVVFTTAPFITFVLPHIQLKDFNMSAVFFAGCGLLFWIYSAPGSRRIWIWLTIGVFFLAVTFRHNAVFAFIPVSLLLSFLLFRSTFRATPFRIWMYARMLLAAIALTFGLFTGKSLFDRWVSDYQNYFVHGCLYSFDLAGISIKTHRMEIPEERLLPGITITELEKVFNPASWDPLWGGLGDGPRILKGGDTKEDLALTGRAWRSAVSRNFGAYLEHRRDHFKRFLASKNAYLCICEWSPETGWNVLNTQIPERYRAATSERLPKEEFRLRRSERLYALQHRNEEWSRTPKIGRTFMLFPSNVWDAINAAVIVSALLGIFVWVKPAFFSETQRLLIPFSMIIFLSGWTYFAAYFFVSVSSDWRYIHWADLSFWIGAALLGAACVERIPVRRFYLWVRGMLAQKQTLTAKS